MKEKERKKEDHKQESEYECAQSLCKISRVKAAYEKVTCLEL